ncbi:MAG: hypothetical protein JF588_13410 [Caulobacterales bacterium]|nr:hypothetical protein [Caulobacterales bacterium]
MAYAAFTLSDSAWRLPAWAFRAWRAEGDPAGLRTVPRPASVEPPSPHRLALLAHLVPAD